VPNVTQRPAQPNGQAPGPLISIEQALVELLAHTRPLDPHEIPMETAENRVLAEPLRSPAAVPPHAIALRDGWAVSAGDVVGASSYAPISVAGRLAWIETGQILPLGTDTVLPPDAVAQQGGFAQILMDAAPGEGVRRPGEDCASGAILREAGERVGAIDRTAALAIGVTRVRVREARVRVVSLPRSAAPDATGELVACFVHKAGASVERLDLPSRDAGAVEGALIESDADLTIVVGGTGRGHDDHAAEALAARGSLIAHGIALRPGETSGCGIVGSTPVILLPGRLEAALAATLMLVLPCLDHLMGAAPRRALLSGPLTRKVASGVGITDVVLLRSTGEALEPLAVGDLTLAAVVGADAWLAVPALKEGFAAGETVAALLL